MNKFYFILIFSFCFTNVTSDYLIFNKKINDYHSIGFNSSYLNYNPNDGKFKISFNGNTILSNNSISLDWLNNSLFSGKDLKNEQDKIDFLSIFDNENISIFSLTQMQFGFNYKDYALLLSPQYFGNILLPYSIIDFMFYGLNFDKNISFDTDKSRFQAVLPLTFAHSRNMDKYLSKFNLPLNNIRAGLSVKLLLGLAFFETSFINSSIDSDEDFVQIMGNIQSSYSLFGSRIDVDENDYGNSEFNMGSNFKFSGNGFALDLSLSADYSKNINFGLSLNNIFGKINWSSSSTYDYNMNYNLNISSSDFEEMSEYTTLEQDSLFSSIITYESNQNTINKKTTSYPSYLLINGNYTINNFIISSYVLKPFDDSYYKNTQISIGTTYNKFKKIPFYFRINFNGSESIKWFSGLNFVSKHYDLKIGLSQESGFFSKAKGFSFGISNTIKF